MTLAGAGDLAPTVTIARLGLHVLAAGVWVGGQIVLLGLLPTVRGMGEDAPRKVANAFARVAWPAYLVLVLTGFWNISADHFSHQSTAWKVTLIVKLVVVALAGLATALHTRATTRRATAVWGAIAGLSSIAALFMGVALAGP